MRRVSSISSLLYVGFIHPTSHFLSFASMRFALTVFNASFSLQASRYKYVSKLTIKLLEEGFSLHVHLLALRRYHFMEVADWADLFITSLWHHKWCVTEADKRISEIQGLLELSVQRSSCERDHNKVRLFVYMKGEGMMPLSASAIGVHSFDFLGLGYGVDWPISIVLTPGALKIYAEIFSFLIQVKLAVSALTDVWCSLKDSMHVISHHSNSVHQREVHHFNLLMKMRHQVNHFVSTLQQYVLSQLSHISWCRFLHSLKHKTTLYLEGVQYHHPISRTNAKSLRMVLHPAYSINHQPEE